MAPREGRGISPGGGVRCGVPWRQSSSVAHLPFGSEGRIDRQREDTAQLLWMPVLAPMAQPAAVHLLTPGSPAYAALKVGAIGSIFALRFALVRRNKGNGAAHEPEPVEVAPPVRRPHPVSKKKKRRKRRPT